MKKQGKVIQIIPNNKIDDYCISAWLRTGLVKSGKDLVNIENLEYPKGLKGYFTSFKKNAPESIFPILMDAKGIKKGDIIEVDVETFKVETTIYIKQEG